MPALAELASGRFGATGTVGAGDPVVTDRFFPVGHSGMLDNGPFERLLLSIIDTAPAQVQSFNTKFSVLVRFLLYLCSHRTTFIVLAVLAPLTAVVIAWTRPTFTCEVLNCYLSAYREDDLRGSFLEDNTRHFSRLIRTSYAFNYYTPNFVQSFHKEAGVELPTVYELDEHLMRHKLAEVDDGEWDDYRLRVHNYRADSVFEFSGGSAPGASGYVAHARTKDLEIHISMPDGVDILPCDGNTYASGIVPEICRSR